MDFKRIVMNRHPFHEIVPISTKDPLLQAINYPMDGNMCPMIYLLFLPPAGLR